MKWEYFKKLEEYCLGNLFIINKINGKYSLHYEHHHWHGMKLKEAKTMAEKIYKEKMGGLHS